MSDINIKAKIEVENIGTLKQQLKEAQNDVQALADKFGATSKEAIEAAKRAAELKDKIGDAKSLIDAFNPDAKFKSLTAALSGAAGGFAAVQGAIGLVGVESEQVEATLLKVNSAMALSEGLQNVGESVDSFKQLGAVITSTTAYKYLDNAATKIATVLQLAFAGAVDVTSTSFKVLRVALISTGIGALVVAIGFAIEKIISFTKSSDEATKKQKELNDQLAQTTKSVIEQGEKFYDSDVKLATAKAKLRGASEKELFEIEQQGIKNRIKLRDSNYENLLKTDKEAATKLKEQNADDEFQITLNKINFDLEEKKREEDKQKELARIRKEQREKAAKESEEARKAELQKIEDEISAAKKRKDDLSKSQDDIDKEKAATNKQNDEDLQNRLIARGQTAIKIADQTIQSNNAIAQSDLAVSEAKKAQQEAQMELGMQTLDILSGLVDKNSAAGKSIAVATAVVNTYEGASKAIAQGGIFGPIAGAAVIAAGLLNVKKIISTKIPSAKGGGSVGDSGSTPSLNASSPISPIQMGTQLNNASIQGIGNAAAGGVNRAYILEADINNSNERQVRLQRAARLG